MPQKGTGIGNFGAMDDQTIRISKFFDEIKLSRSLRPLAVEATKFIEAAEVLRPRKSLLRTSESSRHLNSALFLCFEKKFFGVES